MAVQVDDQWLRLSSYVANQNLDIFVGLDGKNGSEDLLGHDGAVGAGLFDEGGLEVQLIIDNPATVKGLAAMLFLIETLESLEMIGIVYLAIVSRFY